MKVKTPIDRQTFLDGVSRVYRVENAAPLGNKPVERLVQKFGRLPYERRKVGLQRIMVAAQQDVKIVDLIRVPLRNDISTNDVCIIGQTQYRIRQIQYQQDTMPPAMDMTLERVERDYDLIVEEEHI